VSTTLPKTEIAALVATLAGFPTANVIWAGDPVPFLGPDFSTGQVTGLITLNCSARRALGVDEENRTYPDPNTTVITKKGQRVLTISVRLEGYSSDEAFDILEKVRTELGGEENRATLRAAGVAFTEATPVQMLNGVADNRAISVGQMDLMMNQAVTTEKTISQPGYIETVDMAFAPVDALLVNGVTRFVTPSSSSDSQSWYVNAGPTPEGYALAIDFPSKPTAEGEYTAYDDTIALPIPAGSCTVWITKDASTWHSVEGSPKLSVRAKGGILRLIYADDALPNGASGPSVAVAFDIPLPS
jgi:hypothetical protein